MPKERITSDKLPPPSGHFPAGIIAPAGRLVFISGMLAKDASGALVGAGDITAQTRQVCENLKSAVAAAGGTLDDICRVDVHIADMRHFPQIHAVRREYFTGTPPASTMVQVTGFTHPEALIEITAIAVIP
ncbi:RidA family protein [Siccirubricoccus sp. KC 17139]|uniref:RidA family protein n=1 Tax=Siccirubricoccus soli TaxID=2899147 RepID=A0ABT1DAE6_9PROT|nr:RidA family protein [Siccirubricoccus soli]MCO6418918.1 RidA family protein [Siccirubricoccus soli]MCP2685053.1 RidA family protein [Siccirubricoccus soli]